MSRRPELAIYELEVAEGLEALVRAEVEQHLGADLHELTAGKGWLRFQSTARPEVVTRLSMAESAFAVHTFAVPRPRALLGDEHFRRLRQALSAATAGYPEPPAQFELAAAGAESSVMRRLRTALAEATGLRDGGDRGDVQIRLLRARHADGWDALVRLTPRPLSARPWRDCSFPGALNATVAQAMIRLTRPRATDIFVNLMSGSGTLLIERLAHMPTKAAFGVELNAEHLACTRRNLEAARVSQHVQLIQADARAAPLPDGCADALCADLPFGQRMGRHSENERLYPLVLAEAARIARSNALFAVLTHEVQLMTALLESQSLWRMRSVIHLNLRGLHPRIYLLERVQDAGTSHIA
jgi:ubiquinone/menaquinone biosynthesis C-methylase UbiE